MKIGQLQFIVVILLGHL